MSEIRSKKKILLTPMLAIAAWAFTQAVLANEKYPVSTMVMDVKTERVGDVLLRYVDFFEQYPCLRLETLQPVTHKLLDRREVCKIRAAEGTIDLAADTAGFEFKDFQFDERGIRFAVEIIMRQQGSHYVNCTAVIAEKGKLPEPVCVEGAKPTK
jgi:hypothetical protein